jgi:ABC-type bacteriocin/lantibiotic exporter with double-glycine peptidase domain
MYSNYVVEPVIRLAQIWQDFQYTLVSIKNLIELIPYKVSVNNAVLSAFASKDCSLRLRTTGPTIIQKKK